MAKIDENDQHIFCNFVAGKLKNLPYEIKEWTYTMKAYFNDEQNSKTFTIKGFSYIPKINLNQVYFEFDECGVRTKTEKILKIENFSIKKIKINMENSGNYSFHPSNF